MDASFQGDDASVGLNLLADHLQAGSKHDALGGLPQQVRHTLPAIYNCQLPNTTFFAAAPRSGSGSLGAGPVCRGNRGGLINKQSRQPTLTPTRPHVCRKQKRGKLGAATSGQMNQ
jgi:hypothetical protein